MENHLETVIQSRIRMEQIAQTQCATFRVPRSIDHSSYTRLLAGS